MGKFKEELKVTDDDDLKGDCTTKVSKHNNESLMGSPNKHVKF